MGGIVDEPAGFLAILLHEVVFEHFKALGHAFADSFRRDHDDKLVPTIEFVQLKHRLDIDVRLTCAGLHLNIESDRAVAVEQAGRRRYIRRVLD